MALKGKNPIGVLRRGWLGLAAFFALAFLSADLGCQTGTEVSDPHELLGLVQLEDGTPAVGAKVVAIATSVEENPAVKGADSQRAGLKSTDIAYTNGEGKFHFDSLLSGRYDLTFEDSSSNLNLKKVGIKRNLRPILPYEGEGLPFIINLRTPGQLEGTVTDVDNGSVLDSVICQVDGTPYWASTQNGKFHFFLAEGGYRVLCQKPPYTSVSMYTEVNSGQSKEISFQLDQGPSGKPKPFPDTVIAVYNPITGVVTLTWSKVNFPQLVMYGIRARDSAQTGAPRTLLSTDTTTIDQPYKDQSDTVAKKNLYYSVYCLKSDHVFGTGTEPIKVVATRPTSFGADLDVRILPADSAYKVGDTARVVGTFTNPFRDNRLLQWKIKNSNDSLRDLELTGRAGSDTLLFPCDSAGTMQIGIQVTDVSGIVTSAYKQLIINPRIVP